MSRLRIPIHICSFHTASGSGGYGGKTYYWDFSEMFGPLFTDKDGNELKHQPGPRSYAFKAFEIWHRELVAEKSLAMRGQRGGVL